MSSLLAADDKLFSRKFKLSFNRTILEECYHLIPCIAYCLVVLILFSDLNFFDPGVFLVKILKMFFGVVNFLLLVAFIFAMKELAIHRPAKSPIKFIFKTIISRSVENNNILRFISASLSLAILLTAFVLFKSQIPLIKPFAYDQLFEELDRSLHFGIQPWQLLQPLLGHDWISLAMQHMYYLWFPLFYITFVWQAVATNKPQLRMQFILSFIGCWVVIGSIMAVSLSSAGPIFYDRIVSENPDAYLQATSYFDRLDQEHGLVMLKIKELLWEGYAGSNEGRLIAGISAMPSMHVSIAFLMMLLGWRIGPIAGIIYSLFALVIFLGSIHLLWHYAVDGYVAMAATYAIWRTCGLLAAKFHKSSIMSGQAIETCKTT